MPDVFSANARAIFDKKVLAHVASLEPDGSPNVTPVWVKLDGDDIIINTALGRAKARNLASDSRVAVSLTDPDNIYDLVAVRGTVVGFTTEGADQVIDDFAMKYLGVDSYPYRREGEIRVTVRIRPDRIATQPE
ncbi:MAG: PPOX class F420-dependent oxidoreductase [Acidimicrobiaceae bacterium]|nr:PPOX class F420-dependent oxidoreductase [Acidimicrobiaceae bacterium]